MTTKTSIEVSSTPSTAPNESTQICVNISGLVHSLTEQEARVLATRLLEETDSPGILPTPPPIEEWAAVFTPGDRGVDKELLFMSDYYPKCYSKDAEGRYCISRSELNQQELILAFKNGNCTEKVALEVAEFLKNNFEHEEIVNSYIVPVPASSPVSHANRWKKFCTHVSELCGIRNGYDLFQRNEKTKTPKHNRGEAMVHSEFVDATPDVNGACIILFDDIYTEGNSYKNMKDMVQRNGGHVISGVFLGKTISKQKIVAKQYEPIQII